MSSKKLDILQSGETRPDTGYWRPWPATLSLSEAHDRLLRRLHKPWAVKKLAAWGRFRKVYYKPLDSRPRAMVKAFNDMDTVLFRGVLRRRVNIQWEVRLESGCVGQAWYPRMENGLPTKQVHIRLSLIGLFGRRSEHLWDTLMHEMLHAYLYISTGGETDEYYTCGKHLDYGPLFFSDAQALTERLHLKGLEVEDIGGRGEVSLRQASKIWHGREE